ncbi:MAG: hypothetical protein ACK5S6_00165 [bacterium]|jgi:hypothetical protein
MTENDAEHLGSSDCSSGNFEHIEVRSPDWVLNAISKRCVTHHNACGCREYRFAKMQQALIRIMIWAEQDAISGETRQKAMADIAKACHDALEG